ncbi:hypothetical protein BGZ93_004435 [Podila epicladia]|nr:hypothetical protein BGZ92_004342 [Podila epicladia]KAG0100059.1 hypothetical protein BGZ93_004435 [Podila epicladia]
MPNYVSLTESQRRSIALFIIESQQQAQSNQQQQQQQQQGQAQGQGQGLFQGGLGAQGQTLSDNNNSITNTEDDSKSTTNTNNLIPCKEIVQFCQARFGLTISLSTASRLRSSASKRLATELVNPSAKRNRQVRYPEFEKALVLELKALEQEQLQIQQEQERINSETNRPTIVNPDDIPPVMMLSSEAAITQVAKGIAEKMGVKLGLTSGWYHGFRKRHGIKYRSLRSRSSTNLVFSGSSGSGGPSSSTAPDANATADGGNGSDDVDMDEDMEDTQIEMTDPIPVDDDLAPDNGTGKDTTPPPSAHGLGQDGSSSRSKDMPTASTPTPRRPEVKRVTAAAANDALDVISEYLLQNGDVGATKLPLVKELRNYLLIQTELENRAAAAAAAANGGSSGMPASLPLAPPLFVAPIAVSAIQQRNNILLSIPASPSQTAADAGAVSLDAANQLGHLHLTSTQEGADSFEKELQAIKEGNASSLLGLGVGGTED